MTIRFSAAPDWDAIERRTEEVRADANSELRAEGYEAHLVDAGLQFILERVDFSGAVPASSQYFVTAFHGAMADDRDRKKIEKRAARRAAIMKQSEIELRTTAVELERVAKDSGLPIKRLIERRAEGGHR